MLRKHHETACQREEEVEERLGRRMGRVRIGRALAHDGIGETYAGFDELLQRDVTVKLIRRQWQLSEARRLAFLAAARVLSVLQHRNICQVYDYFSDGDHDVLVLERIDGRSLRERLAQPSALSDRSRLDIALQIAEALVCAHERGIAFRDLTLDNVMLTDTGLVKLFSVSLARNASAQSAPASEAAASPASDGQHGQIHGPVPPELARGAAATSASDLWSFGAIVLELLCGRPAVDALGAAAQASGAGLRNVIRHTARLPRAEGRLLAELLQADPSRRPNAREVLQRLGSIRQRGRRRAGLAIAVGLSILMSAGATRYALDLRHERNLALSARSDADIARRQAEDMALFIVEDLYNGLMPVRRLDLLEPVAAKAVGYFGLQGPADGNQAQSPRPERGLALMRAAEVLDFQGRLPESIEAYDRAVSSLEPLAEAEGSTSAGLRARSLLAQALSAQSMTLSAAAQHSVAMVQAQRALDTSLSLIAEVGGGSSPAQIRPAALSLELWQNLLDAYLALGDSQMRAGHPEQAITKLEEAIELAELAVSAHPSIETTRGDLLWTRCMASLESSRRAGQVEACRPSLMLDRQAAADDPDDVQTAFNLANSLWLMSKALGRSGQPMAALAHADEAVPIARELVRHDPGQPQNHNLLAVNLLSRAHALGALQQNAARQRTLEEVLEITGGLVSGSQDHQFMHTHLTVLILLGRMDEARPWAQKLRDAGWKRQGFLDLCQRHALLADC